MKINKMVHKGIELTAVSCRICNSETGVLCYFAQGNAIHCRSVCSEGEVWLDATNLAEHLARKLLKDQK